MIFNKTLTYYIPVCHILSAHPYGTPSGQMQSQARLMHQTRGGMPMYCTAVGSLVLSRYKAYVPLTVCVTS